MQTSGEKNKNTVEKLKLLHGDLILTPYVFIFLRAEREKSSPCVSFFILDGEARNVKKLYF